MVFVGPTVFEHGLTQRDPSLAPPSPDPGAVVLREPRSQCPLMSEEQK